MVRHIEPRLTRWGRSLVVFSCSALAIYSLLLQALAATAYPRHGTLQAARPAQPLTGLSISGQGEGDVRRLERGTPIERELAGGEAHAYRIILAAGQYLRVAVAQRGINVIVKLSGPDGQQITEVNNQNNVQLQEQVSLVANTPGEYRFEVGAVEKTALPGRYEIRIEDLRESTPQDGTRIAAERAYAQGELLRLKGTAESLRKAIPKYEEALPLWRALNDPREQANALHSIALVSRLLGENRKALDYYQQALPLRRAAGDSYGEAMTLNNMGLVYWFVGDHQKGLNYYQRALPLRRAAHDHWGEAVTLNNIGVAYATLGDGDKAIEYYNQAIPLYREVRDRAGEAQTLSNVGNQWRLSGNYQKAMDYYDQSLTLYRTLGDRRGEGFALHHIGRVYWLLNKNQTALDYMGQALQLTRATGDRLIEARVLNTLGSVYSDLNDQQKALDFLGQALQLNRSMGAQDAEADALFDIARVERRRGNLNEARARIQTALDIIESLRAKVASQDLRSSFLASNQRIYKLYIDLLMGLDERQPSEEHAAAALMANERARARSLLESLAEVHADIRQGADPLLLERERDLQQQVNARAERLTRLLGGKHTEEQASAAQKELDSLLTEYQQVQAQIRTSSPRYAALTQPQPLSAQEIQQQVLDGDSLLLEYSLGDERSFLWAVTPNSITSYVLPKQAEIEQAARHVYNLLATRNQHPADETPEQRAKRVDQAEAEYADAAATLSRMLLGPVADRLGAKRLVIVSEGALQYVPFGALPAPSTAGAEDGIKKSPPLIVDHEIVNLPSASVLAVLRRELMGRPPAPRAVAVLADPVFRSDDPRVKLRQTKAAETSAQQKLASPGGNGSESDVERSAKESGVVNFKRLPFSRQEAEAIMALVPVEEGLKAIDFAANRATATSPELSRYRIVHFATHGLLNSLHPELSGIVLSLVDGQGRPQDGFLRLHEIYNLKLGADLVVLSACQTALGREIKGEGLVGLTRGFMYAGAPRVMASLWKVDDRATAELMKRFYAALLKDGRRAPAALRAAQVSMWKEKRWQSPHYWAAFVTQGEWR